MKFEWIVARPGVLALSGTDFQVRWLGVFRNRQGEVISQHAYGIYRGETQVSWDEFLPMAKSSAERKAAELFEIGLYEQIES